MLSLRTPHSTLSLRSSLGFVIIAILPPVPGLHASNCKNSPLCNFPHEYFINTPLLPTPPWSKVVALETVWRRSEPKNRNIGKRTALSESLSTCFPPPSLVVVLTFTLDNKAGGQMQVEEIPTPKGQKSLISLSGEKGRLLSGERYSVTDLIGHLTQVPINIQRATYSLMHMLLWNRSPQRQTSWVRAYLYPLQRISCVP